MLGSWLLCPGFARSPAAQQPCRRTQHAAWAAQRGRRSAKCRADPQRPLAPWSLTFDLRERETLWTEENQARLVRIVAGYELNLEQAEVEQRLAQLLAILPGLEPKLPYVKPSLLAELLRDPGAVMDKLLALKQLLPRADVGKVAVAQPQVLLEDISNVQSELDMLRKLLQVEDVDKAVEENPRFLDSEAVGEVLEEMRRLMPNQDPAVMLLRDPSWLLRVERGAKRLGQSPDEPC